MSEVQSKPGGTTPRKTRSVEIEPFAKWIHGVAPDPSLTIPQFVLYSAQSQPQKHVCKSTMGLVTNDEAILCKAFPSTLFDKALTYFAKARIH